jgi:hypothetical protein
MSEPVIRAGARARAARVSLVLLDVDGGQYYALNDVGGRVWDLETGEIVATLEGHTDKIYGVAISADGCRVVTGSFDKTVRVWDLPPITLAPIGQAEATRYTNAKVLLVGESGVGKQDWRIGSRKIASERASQQTPPGRLSSRLKPRLPSR